MPDAGRPETMPEGDYDDAFIRPCRDSLARARGRPDRRGPAPTSCPYASRHSAGAGPARSAPPPAPWPSARPKRWPGSGTGPSRRPWLTARLAGWNGTPAQLDQLNSNILTAVQHSGQAFIAGTTVAGRGALRVCIVNPGAKLDDIDALAVAILEQGARLRSHL